MSYEGYEKSHISVGPWGGQCGARWDDGVYCSVRQVVISHGNAIHSIQIEYDTMGCSLWSEKHGGPGGARIDKIKLDRGDGEYLISISGYYGSVVECGPVIVRSLLVESNKRYYGPFGVQHGTQFTFPMTGGKIVGFHGRSAYNYLESIGVYLKPQVQKNWAQNSCISNATANGTFNGVGGNQGYDMVVAVRKNSDNALASNRGGAYATHEYERKEKVYMSETEEATAAKGFSYMGHGGNYNEDYMKIVPNHANFRESADQTSNQVYMNGGIVNYNSNGRQAIKGRDQDYRFHEYDRSGYDEVETNFKDKLHLYASGQMNANAKGSSTTYVRPAAVSHGPWGGTSSSGMLFDDGVNTGVREIHLSRTGGVVSIRVCYDKNGQAFWGNKNGGSGALKMDKISLDYPQEYVTHISGYYGSMILRGPTVIKSLTFHTNKKKYGPFGSEQGIPFSSPFSNNSMIVGFHGKKGWFIESIGVHVLEGNKTPSVPRPPNYDHSFNMISTTTDMKCCSDQVISSAGMGRGPNNPCSPGFLPAAAAGPYGQGTWGGDGGQPWDDGAIFTGVRKIVLAKGEAIYSLQIEYDRNGQSVWSAKHGVSNERRGACHVIQFDYPHEVVTCISGYYCPVAGDECKTVIKSLTFYTNKGRYGPYGEEAGTYFTSRKSSSGADQGKIIGFHGRSGCYLYAIGVHMQTNNVNRMIEWNN